MSHADETRLLEALLHGPAVRIVVESTQGSAPRDAGTWMAVLQTNQGASRDNSDNALIGTVGGGHLEFDAIAHARAMLAGSESRIQRRYPLGPTLGQCCGGVVVLRFELHSANTRQSLVAQLDAERGHHMPVALFGGGHVGQAIVRALAPLPIKLRWIDSREGVFADAATLGLLTFPPNVTPEHVEPVQDAVADLAPQSRVLIMSFSHAEDLDIVIACLKRQQLKGDLPFIGLIGSKTKWATFRHRLEARGFDEAQIGHITCPIGVAAMQGKEPAVIAAGVAAQLLLLPQKP